MNADNIVSKVARISLSEKTSRNGSKFVILTILFNNGLEIDYFVDKKDWFGLQNLIKNNGGSNGLVDPFSD